ncbi:MAG: late competence development ComFB family protein [Microcoleaceae cyanobacterium]
MEINYRQSKRRYSNIIEEVVTEEVTTQISLLPAKLVQYIKREQVETYALNRLPPLYACSREGLEQQRKRADGELRAQVKQVVRQALAAIQRDLLRKSTPLFQEEEKVKPSDESLLVEDKTDWNHGQLNNDEVLKWRHGSYFRAGDAKKRQEPKPNSGNDF